MAWSLIASSTNSFGQNGGTSAAVDTTGADLLVAVLGFDPISSAGTAVDDSKGNTYDNPSPNPQPAITLGHFVMLAALVVESPTVGSGHTFTVSGTNVYASLCVYAFSGSKSAAAALDQGNGTGSGGSGVTSVATGSATPTEDNELIVIMTAYSAATTIGLSTGGAGYATPIVAVAETPTGTRGSALAYKVQTTAAAENVTWTSSATNDIGARILTFKAAPTAAQDTPELYGRPRDRRLRQILAQ